MHRLVRVRTVQPLDGYRVRLGFEDGSQREMDLEFYLRGPIFEPIRSSLAMFRSVRVEHGTVAWPNGADIDPDVLYYGLKPAWMEQECAPVEAARSPRIYAPARAAVQESREQYTLSSEKQDSPTQS